jgi:hypothetical protein
MTRRATFALFIFLTALQLAPVWSVRYLPAGDGPTHIYNAWVLHGLVTDTAPPNIERAYRVNWRPHPNWSGHALMALAIAVVPPLVAEKLFVSLILILLCAGAWLLTTSVDPRSDVHAFLVFPFTYTQSLVAGYYNYSLSVGLFLVILAIWWRRRDGPRVPTVAILAALLLLCYFTHPQATLLACASIAFLAIMTQRWWHLAAIVPVMPFFAMFGRTAELNAAAPIAYGIRWDAARILGRLETMHSLGDAQYPLSYAVCAVFAALIVLTLIRERRREANLLAVLALIFAAMMFWLPAPAGTRDLFTQRNSLFVVLTLAAWFTPRVPRKTLLAVLTAVAIANAAIHLDWFRRLGRDLERHVRLFDILEPETTLLPLYFKPAPSPSIVDVYIHAISYVALEKRLVDHANYEPGAHYFPVATRDDAIRATDVEYAPGSIDIARHAARAEYVVTRGLPDDSQQRRDLDQRYRLIRETSDLRIYRRKAPLVDHELMLLPLLGTVHDVSGPHGARWRVEQAIHNRGNAPVRVVFRNCLELVPCELLVAAGRSKPVASTEKFALLHVPRGTQVDATTRVCRADIDRPDLSIDLPAPHEPAFRPGSTRIENIDIRDKKIALRLYLLTERAWSAITIRLRSRATDQVVAQRTLDVAGYDLFENSDLQTDFPGFDKKADAVDLEIEVEDGRVWAFVTATNEAGQAVLHLPR